MRTTIEDFRVAGRLMEYMELTDKELAIVIAGLEHVIPWLEGAGYSRRIIGPLRQELSQFYSFRNEREKE